QLKASHEGIKVEGTQEARRTRVDVHEAAILDAHGQVTRCLAQAEGQRRAGPLQLPAEVRAPADHVRVVAPQRHDTGQIRGSKHTFEAALVDTARVIPFDHCSRRPRLACSCRLAETTDGRLRLNHVQLAECCTASTWPETETPAAQLQLADSQ